MLCWREKPQVSQGVVQELCDLSKGASRRTVLSILKTLIRAAIAWRLRD